MVSNSTSPESTTQQMEVATGGGAHTNLSCSEHQAVASSAIARRAPCFSARSDTNVRPSNTGSTTSKQYVKYYACIGND